MLQATIAGIIATLLTELIAIILAQFGATRAVGAGVAAVAGPIGWGIGGLLFSYSALKELVWEKSKVKD